KQILNSFLQERQSQTNTANGSTGRLIGDTYYDSLGRPSKANQPYFNDASYPVNAVWVPVEAEVFGQTWIEYDGQGRTTA
ncbi:hypothetical protein, partial [Streptomyces sp. SID3212]